MALDPNRARDVFLSAAEVPGPERGAYLDRACGPDAELRAAVERLLAAHADPASLLEPARPPLPLTDPHSPQPDVGTILMGRYKLLEQIGEGGMGAVWMAQQTEPMRRTVAIKLIKPGMDSRAVLARFEAERQALALMDHPNIARVLDAGAAPDGRPFFVMELVRGTPITEFCDARRLTPRQRLELFVPVCQAIQHAHQKGIIHRDLKPNNVLVALYDDRAVPKIIDFGVAKATIQPLTEHTLHTAFGTVIGTPQYMSPEQATFNNLDVDTRSDLYSLGVLLYELLTGSPPFSRKELERAGMFEMLRLVREVEPPRPSAKLSTADTLPSLAANRSTEPKKLTGMLRNELDWIVMKALEKDRTRRYETANGFAADVLRYLSGEPVQAVPPSWSYRLRKFVRKHKGPVGAALVFVSILLAGILGTTVGLIRAERESVRANGEADRANSEAARANEEATRARDEAEKARSSAAVAGRASQRAQRLLGLRNAEEGVRLAADGQLELGLLKMAHSLNIAPDSPEAVTMARTQFALYRRYTGAPYAIRVFVPHSGIAVYSADGTRFLTADSGVGAGPSARVWDAESGAPLGPVLHHEGPVWDAAFSPDGARVVTGSGDMTARVWDAKTGIPIALMKHTNTVRSVAFSPDGRWVLTGSYDDTARVWDATSGVLRTREPLRHPGTVWQAVLSPDGQRVLTGCGDGNARVWDAKTGNLLLTLSGHDGDVIVVAFSPDGRWIATGSEDKTARLWDGATGQLHKQPLKHDGAVHALAFSPDGLRLVTGATDRAARVWDTSTGTLVCPALPHGNSVEAVAFSPDGRRVLTGSADRTARIWDPNTGKPLALALQHADEVASVAFAPDGRRILTGSDCARVWEITGVPYDPPAQQNPAQSFFETGQPVEFAPDRRRVLIGGADARARILDVGTGSVLTLSGKHSGPVVSVAFSPNGRRVVTGSKDKSAQIWDAETGAALAHLSHGATVSVMAFSPDGHRIVTGGEDGTARIWDAETGNELHLPLRQGAAIFSVAFSPDGRRVATGGGLEDPTAKIVDLTTGVVLTLPHKNTVVTVMFSPDGRWVLTGSHDKTARVWDADTGKAHTPPLEHTAPLTRCTFSPDGARVLTGSHDSTARVWDADTGRALTPSLQHADSVTRVAFAPDGRRVLTGSRDETVRLWDTETGKALSPPLHHRASIWAMAFTPDGYTALTCSGPDAIHKWDLTPDNRPAAEIIELAQMWSAHRVDDSGAFSPISVADLSALRGSVRAREPDAVVRPEAIRRWREREIRDCMEEGNVRAARFHYWALVADLASGKAK